MVVEITLQLGEYIDMAKQVAAEGTLVQLDPKIILADSNTRYGLKEDRIAALASNITEVGGVMQPVEVEPYEGENGFKYRLTTGFYRHAAVQSLNVSGAGLSLPAIIHTSASEAERLKRQISENMERENQSPMDMAIAVKKLLDSGMPKGDVRVVFSRPGGRKGNKVQPASNSWVNMMLSFLNFPKKIQSLVHAGTLPVSAAYQLSKSAPEKWDSIVESAEKDISRQREQEEKDEEKFLAAEKKAAVAKEAQEKLETALTAAGDKLAEMQTAYTNSVTETKGAYDKSIGKHANAKDRKTAENYFKTCEAARLKAASNVSDAERDLAKAKEAFDKATQVTQKATGEAVAAKPKKAKETVSAKAVEKASSGYVALSAKDMRDTIDTMALDTPSPDKVAKTVTGVGKAIQRCFQGITTDKQMYAELKKVLS